MAQLKDTTINGTLSVADVGGSIISLLDYIYPVGAIYISVNNTNPGTFLGGTWEQIKDRFLLSAGDTYAGGGSGGSANAIVVSHNHTFTGSAVASGIQSANHSHNAGTDWAFSRYKGTRSSESVGGISGDGYVMTQVADGGSWGGTASTSTNSVNHTHSVTATGTIGYTGNAAAGANMPPYLTVYMYKRIA